MNISKELLSAVLGINCTQVEIPIEGHNLLGFETDNKDYMHTINIHELAHKVKEWAVEGWDILSSASTNRVICVSDNRLIDNRYFYADTEPEAVFKAGQWILDSKDKS